MALITSILQKIDGFGKNDIEERKQKRKILVKRSWECFYFLCFWF